MNVRALTALLSDIATAVRASRAYSDLSLAAGTQPGGNRALTGLLPR